MFPILRVLWNELNCAEEPERIPEPTEAMLDPEQVRSYVKTYDWGGPCSALQLHHLRELSRMIRPGDRVLDLACGPGPLLLELAPLFPSASFIGVDLSPAMVAYLRGEAHRRGLSNIEVLEENACALPSISEGSMDLVICTSALHHLPDSESVGRVFSRIRAVLKPTGGYYLSDFGQVRSHKTRELLVQDSVRKGLPPVAAQDYAHSLRATFSSAQVLRMARRELPAPHTVSKSFLIDFLYFVQSPYRSDAPESVSEYIRKIWRQFSWEAKLEFRLLRWLRHAHRFSAAGVFHSNAAAQPLPKTNPSPLGAAST